MGSFSSIEDDLHDKTNLAASIDSETLYRTFAATRVVLSCKVERHESGKSLEFGFIQFHDKADAERSMKSANGMLLEGKQVNVGPFISRKGEERRIDMMRPIRHYDVSPQMAAEPIEKESPSIDSTDDEAVCTNSTLPTNEITSATCTADAARVQITGPRNRPRKFSNVGRKARAQQILEPARAAIVAQKKIDSPLYDPSNVPSSEPWPLQPWSVHTLKTMYASARLPEERLAMLGGTLVPLVENLTFEFCKEVTDELIKGDIEVILLLMKSSPALEYKVDEIKRQVKKKVADQAAVVTALSPVASRSTLTKVVSKSSDLIPAATAPSGPDFFDVLNGATPAAKI